MKKIFCLLITDFLLLGLTPFAFAETTEADNLPSIQEQLEKLWDFTRSILNKQEETAIEKQIKTWKEKGAYVARTQIYILYILNQDATSKLDGVPAYAFDGFGEEVLLDMQRRMPSLAPLSLDELRERIFVDNPPSTRILDIYTASYQDGAEALEFAQALSAAFCELFAANTNAETPVMLALPTLLD